MLKSRVGLAGRYRLSVAAILTRDLVPLVLNFNLRERQEHPCNCWWSLSKLAKPPRDQAERFLRRFEGRASESKLQGREIQSVVSSSHRACTEIAGAKTGVQGTNQEISRNRSEPSQETRDRVKRNRTVNTRIAHNKTPFQSLAGFGTELEIEFGWIVSTIEHNVLLVHNLPVFWLLPLAV